MVTKGNQRPAPGRARQIIEAQRRAQARRQRLVIAAGAIAAVLVAVGILVLVKFASGGSKPAGTGQPAGAAPPAVLAAVTAVPAGVLDKVGTGKVNTLPKAITGQSVLTENGRPLVLYVGAEYCPYCAAERWAMVVALSRFGTFANLGQTHSASNDVYPDTATLSFHGATYTSQYLSFQGLETRGNTVEGNSYAILDTPTAAQLELMRTYNAPPYVPADSAGSIPFIDFANQALVAGASFSPQLLAGRSAEQIAAALSDPASPIAQGIGGTANAFTALLCQLTKGQPGAVCDSPAAGAYKGKFGASG